MTELGKLLDTLIEKVNRLERDLKSARADLATLNERFSALSGNMKVLDAAIQDAKRKKK